MKNIKLITILFFVIISGKLFPQEMKWEWASFASRQDPDCWFENISCDFNNDFYVSAHYDTLLVVGDTSVYHPNFFGGNYAVIKYKKDGTFDKLIDFFTVHGSYIFRAISGTDQNKNLYLSCEFSKRVFFLDTMVNHCNTPYIESPDVLITKIDANNQIKWIRTIGGTLQDDLLDIYIDENANSYILSEQMASSSYPTTVSFFLQDTVYSDQDFTSLSKLNENGMMMWRIDLFGEITTQRLRKGKDGIIYLWGKSYSDIIYEGDTIFMPSYPNYNYPPFMACINEDGILQEIKFVNFPVFPYDLEVDESGNLFLSGVIYNNTIIGQDTIQIPDDLYYGFIGKFDPFLYPSWYHIIPRIQSQEFGIIHVELHEDNLYFASYSNRDIHIADTILEVFYMSEAYTGIFNANGVLEDVTISRSSREFRVNDFILDNCNNPILAGSIRDKIYLHNDTAQTFSNSVLDGALVKVRKAYPQPINIGPDTSACLEYTIAGPPGYLHYMLNDSIIEQNTCIVPKSGTYIFGCTNDGCWLYDTINVQIHPGFEFSIGNDTTIFDDDTITLTITGQYDSVIWFNGANSNEIVIPGSDFTPGTYTVWADAFDGPCSSSDTLYITIKTDFGTEENNIRELEIYPNPCHDAIEVKVLPAFKEIFIYNMAGNIQFSKTLDNSNKNLTINTSSFESGVYLVKIITDERTLTKKLIKK
jgi:hypothetical protein